MDTEAHMKAKRLEAMLGVAANRTGAEMVMRFQKLRDNRLLPTSRGRNAEHIAVDGVVSGILAMVAEKPGFAGLRVLILRNLRPVGGRDQSFAKAETFGAALHSALEDDALLDSILEIRLTEDEINTNSNGRGVIFYQEGGMERTSYYVGHTAVSLLQAGAERTFNPRSYNSPLLREITIQTRLLKKIMREYREEERFSKLMEDLEQEAQQGRDSSA